MVLFHSFLILASELLLVNINESLVSIVSRSRTSGGLLDPCALSVEGATVQSPSRSICKHSSNGSIFFSNV